MTKLDGRFEFLAVVNGTFCNCQTPPLSYGGTRVMFVSRCICLIINKPKHGDYKFKRDKLRRGSQTAFCCSAGSDPSSFSSKLKISDFIIPTAECRKDMSDDSDPSVTSCSGSVSEIVDLRWFIRDVASLISSYNVIWLLSIVLDLPLVDKHHNCISIMVKLFASVRSTSILLWQTWLKHIYETGQKEDVDGDRHLLIQWEMKMHLYIQYLHLLQIQPMNLQLNNLDWSY